jgi:AcrR family transcriptional regulator
MALSRPTPIDLHILQARVRLIQAARELFLTGPCTSVTVEDICMAAAVSKGGFYHHFPDKEAVFLAIALDELEREAASIADGREDPAEPDVSALLVDLWALVPRRPPALRQVRAVHRRALKQALQSQLDALRELR